MKRQRQRIRSYRPRYRSFKRRAQKMTIPIAPIMGLAAGMSQPVELAIAGNWGGALQIATMNYTGYDVATKKFYWGALLNGLAPLMAGILVHKFIGGTMGVNRMLAKSKVPYVRL